MYSRAQSEQNLSSAFIGRKMLDDFVSFANRVLCETVKEFAARISEASQMSGDQQLAQKCQVLQQKLDLLIETMHNEESYISDTTDETESPSSNQGQLTIDGEEKGALEKPEKDITNLKRVKKRRNFIERESVMSR